MLTSNSSGNMQIHGYLACFHDTVRQGKYILGLGNLLLFYPFRTVFFLSYPPPPPQRSCSGGTLVSHSPSVRLWTESCPLCISHNTSRIHFKFTDLINQLRKVCRVLRFVKNSKIWIFGNFFKCSPFTLSCVHVMWMLKVYSPSEFLYQQLLILHNDTSRWFTKHTLQAWPKLQFCIFGLFFNCTFSHSLCGGIKDKVDSFLLQSLWQAGNLTCWCILTTLRTD